MKLVVFGATGATGRHVVRLAAAAGWTVVAFVRSQAAQASLGGNPEVLIGDPTDRADVLKAVSGADAVAVCLGISRRTRSPFAALVTAPDFTSRAVAAIVQVMRQEGVRRIVYISAFGAGDSWALTPWWGRAFIALSKIKVTMADHTRSEKVLAESSLDWTVLRPVLLDDTASPLPAAPRRPGDPLLAKVPRESVARTIVRILADRATYGQAIALTRPRCS